MIAIGNENINKIYEYHVPATWNKPNSKTDRLF